jgi:hypothetical protein
MTDPYRYLHPKERLERELSDRHSNLVPAIVAALCDIAPDSVIVAEETLSGYHFVSLDVAALLRLLAAVRGTDLAGIVSILEEDRS